MESEILKFICANQGAVDTDFLECNLGSSVLEILSSSDKCLPCCPFGQPKVVARTKVRVCRTRDCPGSCQALHLCNNLLFSGSCQYNLNGRRGCVFSHELDLDHNEAILKEHELEHLSRTELCTLLLQSDNRLLPQLCHDYNTGDDVVFGGCKEGFACKRLHICEKFLNTSCNCSRNHSFRTPQTSNLLQGVPHDLAFKSIYANIQALKYYDIQSNKAKRGNQQLQVKKGNRNRGRRGGRVKKPSFSTNGLEDNTDAECQQQPAEGAVSTTTMGAEANSCDEQLPLVTPRLPVPGTYQQSSKGSVGTLTSVIPAAVNAGAHQQLQRATAASVIPAAVNAGAQQQLQRATAASVIPAAVNAGAQQQLQRATAASVIPPAVNAGAHQQLQRATAASVIPAAVNAGAHQQLQRATAASVIPAAVNAGAHQQLQRATAASVIPAAVNAGAQQQLQRATAASVIPAAVNAGAQLQLQRATAATSVIPASVNAGAHQLLQRATAIAASNIPAAVTAGTQQQLQPATAASNIPAAVSDRDNKDDGSNTKGLPIDKSEICMAFIKGDCKNLERCVRAHDRMPYRWEVKKSGQWFPLPNNEEIERDFCDPKMTYSSSPQVRFDTMTCGFHEARRISTCNSLLEPDFSLATEWLWYWEDERGKWNLYASPDGGHNPADVDSSVLERRFLSDANDVVNFNAHSQKYCLRFKDMLQTNITYGTKKAVRRRPRFVSAADVRDGTLRKPGEERGFAAIPNHWDKIQLPQTGYKRVPLVSSSDEYKEVEALFRKTMRGFDISKIERIQNKALWEVFQLQKAQMKNKNGGLPVLELKLFHGTDNQHVDTICHSNLDWRLCGSHGTAYGKGSYFAVDAQYSHHYTSDSDVRSMFVVRLLVGKYTTGSPEYRRPPSKDGGDINFYDSCVDNVHQPSIYVVFDKPQIYPEYLLQYRDNNFTSVLTSGISRSSGMNPYLASQASTPSHQPSVSFSKATASSTFSQPNQTKASEEKSSSRTDCGNGSTA
uniref:Uncharacterized LOC101067802 n=1 Tax=Takifugu rubripes TaxID=31033 RepID=A0A674NDR9_TAKRU